MVEELFFKEFHTPNTGLFLRLKYVLYSGNSDYQKIMVLDSADFGKVLVIDGRIVLTEVDEFIYHEMLVHPAIVTLPVKSSVLLLGGGDGGALREILKHRIRNLTGVQIDDKITDVCKRFFPDIADSFDKAKIDMYNEDAADFVKSVPAEKYDAVIVDPTDPEDYTKKLYGTDFFNDVRKILTEKGFLVLPCKSYVYNRSFMLKVIRRLKDLFPYVFPYFAPVPTYPGVFRSFVFASFNVDFSASEVLREPSPVYFYSNEMRNVLLNYVPKELKDEIAKIGPKE